MQRSSFDQPTVNFNVEPRTSNHHNAKSDFLKKDCAGKVAVDQVPQEQNTNTSTLPLHHWTLSFLHQGKIRTLPATVPGNVEIDLKRAGLLSNPHPPDHIDAMHLFESVDWVYDTVFEAPSTRPGEQIILALDGVDTIADVLLNGEKILHCENMFIPHRVNITEKVNATDNHLQIKIFSPELHARQFTPPAIHSSREHRHGEAYLRKARHMWGWDNAPRLLSAGIWRKAYLEVLRNIRFTEVYAYTNKVEKEYASIGIDWNIATPDVDLSGYKGKVVLSLAGKIQHEQEFAIEFTSGSLRRALTLKNPKLWWPLGYGEPTLYDLQLVLYKNNQPVTEWHSKFGIREIELIRTESTNANGDGEFLFKCNGEKIYIRGTNWKPVTPLHSQSRHLVTKALDLCVDLNCNMVRVWGGGIYEDHDFFNYCDEHGLLVWQDFMFACEFPPQDDFFQKMVSQEAEAIVKRLRNHPSLALWCGDNEVDEVFFWGTLVSPKLLPSDNAITRNILRKAVRHYDPYRDYMESSPYISDEVASKRRHSPDCRLSLVPEQHAYVDKSVFLNECHAHFVSETGKLLVSESPDIVQLELPRAKRLWKEDCSKEAWKNSEAFECHQLDGYFITAKEKIRKSINTFFQCDFPIEMWPEFSLAANITGGDYFKSAIEHFRIGKWRRTGLIWWSLLDMWPMVFNASLVDSNFKKKMPYYWIRQSQQPLCLMARESGAVQVYAANDTRQASEGRYRILQVESGTQTSELQAGDFSVLANETALVATLPVAKNHRLLILEWEVNDRLSFNHFVSGTPPFSFEKYREWVAYLSHLYKQL